MIVKITEAEYVEANELYYGYCTACGEQQGSCEPDARNYPCEACGENKVYGAEELLLMGGLEIQ